MCTRLLATNTPTAATSIGSQACRKSPMRRSSSVVVLDDADGLRVQHRGADDVAQVHLEALVGLQRRVAVDGNADRLAGLARRDHLAGQVERDIVGTRPRGAVGGGDVEADV